MQLNGCGQNDRQLKRAFFHDSQRYPGFKKINCYPTTCEIEYLGN